MSVRVDLDGTSELRQDARGYVDTIEILVEGVSVDPYAGRLEALEADGVPRMGDPHPQLPIEVVNTSARAITGSPSRKLVRIEYGTPDFQAQRDRTARYGPVEWSGGVRIYTETTTQNWRGRVMRVAYNGIPQFDIGIVGGGSYIGSASPYTRTIRSVRADVDRSLIGLVARRWERDDPEARLRSFANVTNAEPWRGYAPQTVLSEGASFEPDIQGGWRVEYVFAYKANTWKLEQRITINGAAPVDLTEGNGLAFHEIYQPVSFAGLELN